MKTLTTSASVESFMDRIQPEHPELDQPEGELSWQRWLEGRQRLETALLLCAR